MITRDTTAFFECAKQLPFDAAMACAKGFFVVSPIGFSLAKESAQDNRYMQMQAEVSSIAAMEEHRAIQAVLREVAPVTCFPGAAETPDAVFPNNVFAITPEHLIIGHMRHSVRQREAQRLDIRRYFTHEMARREIDLSAQNGIAELTGSLIIDRARHIGYCGLSERCDEAGAKAMAEAFGLKAMLLFDLAVGEYHTNVVLSVLAGRAVVIAPCGFAESATAQSIIEFYGPNALVLSAAQKHEYAGNCLAISDSQVFFSARAAESLSEKQHAQLQQAGFKLRSVAMPILELAGGSVRCCIAEIY